MKSKKKYKKILFELIKILNINDYEECVMPRAHDYLHKNKLPSWYDNKN